MLQLLDFAGIYFRAFHAVPGSTVGPHGRPTNAVRGALDITARVVADTRPSRLVACLDLDWRPAWRVELLPSYKAHRVERLGAGDAPDVEQMPDELTPQIPVLLDVIAAIGIASAGAEQCEADDVIATLASNERVDPVEVVTGDRDLMQLADDTPPGVRIRYIGAGMSKQVVLDAAGVHRKYGVPATGYADYATLRGDPSDGLPGVPGVGDKTAAALIGSYGNIDAMLTAAGDPASAMASGPRRKLLAAADYLAAAPAVVAVRRDAEVLLSGPDAVPGKVFDRPRLDALVAEHGLAGPVERLLRALGITG
ncbi:5'-3' exonuclease [Nakamurella aerolata]|uniref:5'-3' exonuclease n=1 Tax=Nakamurella aerolata TaxID=1656892 RepID=A0A849A623_9ACTN|nr:5'-3' exonuclease H3TH domain-containing protein [Nakamurella aerolata]NNG34471.1 flap endonuclease [Nakamurella aerolata]